MEGNHTCKSLRPTGAQLKIGDANGPCRTPAEWTWETTQRLVLTGHEFLNVHYEDSLKSYMKNATTERIPRKQSKHRHVTNISIITVHHIALHAYTKIFHLVELLG
jgi:hypothetical protein